MAEYNVARGTRDILAGEKRKEKIVCDVIEAIAKSYGFKMIETPIFEQTELFARNVGESSDIVNKEMYTFLDKGNRSLTLRPEGTAGTIRLFVNNKLYNTPDLPVKLMYLGPAFRYERPQSGRYRQFKQFGFEVIGLKDPYVDVELMLMVKNILEALGFKNLTISINTLGDEESRNNYKQALKEHFSAYLEGENALCEDCRRRIEQNPLRILDCKVDSEHPAIKSAPKIKDYLNKESKEYLEKVKDILRKFKINYRIDQSLVRGLDYYNDIVFEITNEEFGALGAGGRYDNLVKQIGGPSLPATGMAFGIDRLVLALEQASLLDDYEEENIYVFSLVEEGKEEALRVCEFLRENGFICETDFQTRSIKSEFKTIERKQSQVAVIIGEDELKGKYYTVKDTINLIQSRADSLRDLLDKIDYIMEAYEEYAE